MEYLDCEDEIVEAQLYRLYNEVATDSNYLFSIVAGKSEVYYVSAKENLDVRALFNKERIQERILSVVEEGGQLPTTPEDWASFALYNTGNSLVVHVEQLDSDDIDSLLEEEQSTADYLYEKYAYMKELPNG